MTINYESLQIGDVRAEQVSAAPGLGASLLRFTMIWSMHPRQDQTYSVFGTYLRVLVGPEGTTESLYLGHALPELAWSDESRPGIPVERPLMYLLTLHADQLLAVELLRGSRGLRFKIELRGNSYGPHGIRQIDASREITVTLSDWIRILRESSAKDILLVGVQIPRESEQPQVGAAFQYVRRAYDFLLRGENSAAVAECRRALESVWKSQGFEQSAGDARKALSANMDARKSMGKRERQLALGEALRNFTHPAHHVQDDGRPEDFSRADAAMAVSVTAGLISALVVGQ
jgi:hypothetical protein